MASRPRVVIAGLFHETNTFVEAPTTLADFAIRHGEELLSSSGDGSPLAGVLHVAAARGWDLVPATDVRAVPSGPVVDEVVDLFLRALESTCVANAAGGIDGVVLVLHGAMVCESLDDVEGAVLQRLRVSASLTTTPISVVVDLHANVTAAMAAQVDVLVSYRENPHTDGYACGMLAAERLDTLLTGGRRARTFWRGTSLVWPPGGTGTADEPMRGLEAIARDAERSHDEILAVNVHAGFAFADTHDTGVSFSVSTLGDPLAAQAVLAGLVEAAEASRDLAHPSGVTLDDAVASALRTARGTAVLVEPADNIGAGAPGDLTTVLAGLLERRAGSAGVIIDDPAAVATLWERVGASVPLSLGGRSGVVGAQPLPLQVEVLSRSDGRFDLEDRTSHLASMGGVHVDMGQCVLARCEGATILLTSRKTPPFDLGQWRSQGVAPESLRVIAVKSAVGHRQAYAPLTAASYVLDTLGPCTENLTRLPYQRIRRPVHPLDPI